jgi:hypothetical protein
MLYASTISLVVFFGRIVFITKLYALEKRLLCCIAFVVEKIGSLKKFNKELLHFLAAEIRNLIVLHEPIFLGYLREVVAASIFEIRKRVANLDLKKISSIRYVSNDFHSFEGRLQKEAALYREDFAAEGLRVLILS